jgi:hypothetical protein
VAVLIDLEVKIMPTVLKVGSYRLFFYAGDRDEPAHVPCISNVRIRWPNFGSILFGYTAAEDSTAMRSVSFTGLWSRTRKIC